MSLPETYKALVAQEPGTNTGPKFIDLPLPKPGKDQVLVKVEYVPLHPLDIDIMNGGYLPLPLSPHPVGVEGSGTVVAVGTDLKVPHKVGDKVYVLAFGAMSQYVVCESQDVATIEEGLSLEEAANHFGNPGTVGLMGVVAEKGGHKAVINAPGAAALGRMLIKYLNHKGIKTIAIVRRDEHIEELKKEGAAYVLNQQAPDFEKQLKEVCEKENITMALDAVGGELTNKIWKTLKPGSKYYMVDRIADDKIRDLDIMEFFQGKSISGINIFEFIEELKAKGEFVKFYKEIHSLLPTILTTKVIKVFKLDELKEALEFFKANSSKGKILLKPN